jgi:hypothetical protein
MNKGSLADALWRALGGVAGVTVLLALAHAIGWLQGLAA